MDRITVDPTAYLMIILTTDVFRYLDHLSMKMMGLKADVWQDRTLISPSKNLFSKFSWYPEHIFINGVYDAPSM